MLKAKGPAGFFVKGFADAEQEFNVEVEPIFHIWILIKKFNSHEILAKK